MIETSKKIFDTSSKPLMEGDIAVETRLHHSQVPPEILNQRHIGDQFKVVKFGLAADRPDGTTRTRAYFATDTGVLSMWTGTQWLSVTLV